MRCIASATFLAANLVALSLFLEKPRSWLGAATLGGSLALGIYAYTSSRVPPLAYALFALGQIVHAGHERWVWLAGHARVVFVATLMSLPNILYAVREPEKFFGRGQYNVVGTATMPATRPSSACGTAWCGGPSRQWRWPCRWLGWHRCRC
jgi:hypothetical protein